MDTTTLRRHFLALSIGVMCSSWPVLGHSQTASENPEPSSAEEANRQAATPMSLKEALGAAIRQNPGFRQVEVNIEAEEGNRHSQAGVDDWTLYAEGRLELDRPSLEGAFLPGRTALDAVRLSTGFRRELRTGGTFSLSAGADYARERFKDDGPAMDFIFADSKTLSAGLSAKLFQPLLRGYGEKVARAELAKSKLRVDEATVDLTIEGLELTRSIISAYWELVYASQVRDIRVRALDLASEQLRITLAIVRVGNLAPTAALPVKQAIAVKSEAVMLADIEVSERSLEVRQLAGLEIGPGEIDLQPTETLNFAEANINLDEAITRALAQSPRLAKLEFQRKRARVDVAVRGDARDSRLDLTMSAGPTARSDDANNVLTQLGTFSHPRLAAGLLFEKQLGNRTAEGQYMNAEAVERSLNLEAEVLRRRISVAVVRAVNLVRTAGRRVAVTDTAIELAQQNLAVENARFQVGKSTNFDVLERQAELELASVSRARAVVDALVAAALLETLTGDLLKRNNIEVLTN